MKLGRNENQKGRRGAFGGQSLGMTISILGLIIAMVLLASYGIMDTLERRTHASAEKLVSQVVEHIDGKMNEVRDVTRAAAQTARAELNDPDALEQLVLDFVSRNAFVYGSTVAFEPDRFPDRGRCFAPYSWKTSDGKVHSRQLGTETDYYQEEWYAETKLSGEEYWCEPYYDEGGAKIMMCTFSIPLTDSKGDLTAVMTADVGLEDLEKYVSSISPYPGSYIVLRSQKGVMLANAEQSDAAGSIIIKGTTDTGWSVELNMPFTFLMHGDAGVYFLIGIILLFTIIFVFVMYRYLYKLQQRATAEYVNVIDALSSSFSSIFLVNLLTDETYTFREPSGYEQILEGSSGGDTFSAKIGRLIEYDCLTADRDMMLQACELQEIRRRLTSQDRYEVRFRKQWNGGINWYEMHVFILERDAAGEPVRSVVAFANVNESVKKEKEAQETLEQALAMAQTANIAKTNFLFSMSHDIRTPLNAILGFTSMAKKHIEDREKVQDCLEKTQQSGNLLLALINSVLEVSRIESGQAEISESVANIEYSFTAIEDTLKDLAATKDIDLRFAIGPIKDKYVYCDLDRCNRIFINIISNAIKYTNAGGRIRVSCEQIGSDQAGYGRYRYIFSDNGIGMSEEFQKHVFEHFSREKTSTVSGVQGSGLGMAVCKSFVDLMGGTIECRSKLGEGTVFTVILPFRLQDGSNYIDPYSREEISAAEAAASNRRIVLEGKRALLVDDNELNREIAEEILGEEGLLIETAEDGSAAVALVRERGPEYFDFILMDIQMPVMNGYEATKEIRSLYPDVHIPIIALSANAFDEDRRASKEAGMDAHVAKPINIKELFSTLSKCLK